MKKSLGALAAAVTLLAFPSPAHAETTTVNDPRNDVMALGGWEVPPEMKEAAELSRVVFTPTARTLTVTWRVGRVYEDGNAEGAVRQKFSFDFWKMVDGFSANRGLSVSNTEKSVHISGPHVGMGATCQRAVVKYGAKRVRLTVPYACLGEFEAGTNVSKVHANVSASRSGDSTVDGITAYRNLRLR